MALVCRSRYRLKFDVAPSYRETVTGASSDIWARNELGLPEGLLSTLFALYCNGFWFISTFSSTGINPVGGLALEQGGCYGN